MTENNQNSSSPIQDVDIQKFTGVFLFGGTTSKFLLDQEVRESSGYCFYDQKCAQYRQYELFLKKQMISEGKNLKNYLFTSLNQNVLSYVEYLNNYNNNPQGQ